MADEKEEPQLDLIDLPSDTFTSIDKQIRSKSEYFERLYANSVAVQVSPWDIAIIFGEILGKDEDGRPRIEETVQVTLTREVAKALGALIGSYVRNYEKQVGKIAVPKPSTDSPLEPPPATEPDEK